MRSSRSAWALAWVAAALGLVLASCGGSSSPAAKTPPGARPFVPVLVDQLVAQDAYISALYSNAAGTTSSARAVVGHWSGTLHVERLRLTGLRVPPRARSAYADFGAASRNLSGVLTRVRGERSVAAMHPLFPTALNPAIVRFQNAEVAFRKALGIDSYAWFSAQGLGSRVYSDSLSAPDPRVKWLLGPNVRYAGGGLRISAVNSTGLSAPVAGHRFDRRHVAIEVDVAVTAGTPALGILCPSFAGRRRSYLLGQIGPGARYSFGYLHVRRSAYLLVGPNGSSAIKTSGTNHLRLDCDQYSSRFATARLYANGKLLGTDSLPGRLSATDDGGLLVGIRGAAATAVFRNWKVSKLSSGR